MFCPPEVRARYAKKYGERRVERYERDLRRRQKKGGSPTSSSSLKNDSNQDESDTVGTNTSTTKKFLRFRKGGKRKLSKNSSPPNTTSGFHSHSKNNGTNGKWNPTNMEPRELGEGTDRKVSYQSGKEDNNDGVNLDDEFAAYAEGSTSSSEDDNDDMNNQEYYEDSTSTSEEEYVEEAQQDDELEKYGKNKRKKNVNDLWSLPNDESLKLFENTYLTKESPATTGSEVHVSSTTKKNKNTSFLTSSSSVERTPGSNEQERSKNVVDIVVRAFQGMQFFSPDFFDNSNGGKNRSNRRLSSTSETNNRITTPNENSTCTLSPEEQRRANELVAALGMFDDSSSSSPLRLPFTSINPQIGVDSVPEGLTSDRDDDDPTFGSKEGTSPHRIGEGNLTSQTPSKSDYYYGGTYNDDGDDDNDEEDINDDEDNDDVDNDKDDETAEASTSSKEPGTTYKSQYWSPTQNKRTCDMIIKRQLKMNDPSDITTLAQTSQMLRSMLNEDSQPQTSIEKKRQYTNHYAQGMQGQPYSKSPQTMKTKFIQQIEDDEIMDLDEDEDDADGTASDESDGDDNKNAGIIINGSGAGGAGVNHVGANVFLLREQKARYHGSNRNVNYGSYRRNSQSSNRSRSSGLSVSSSLSNIDENVVVDSCIDDVIPVVNRLILQNPGAMWEENHGRLTTGMHPRQDLLPNFTPRYEENDEEVNVDEQNNDLENGQPQSSWSPSSPSREVGSTSLGANNKLSIQNDEASVSSPTRRSTDTNSSKNSVFCFGGIQLVTPSLFQPEAGKPQVPKVNSPENNAPSTSIKKQKLTTSLSSMVHVMDAAIFTPSPAEKNGLNNNERNISSSHSLSSTTPTNVRTPERIVRQHDYMNRDPLMKKTPGTTGNGEPRSSGDDSNMDDNLSISSAPTFGSKTSTPMLNLDLYTMNGRSPTTAGRSHSRLASSFRSTASRTVGRASYKLGSGKRAMSEEERTRLHSMLPNRPVITLDKSSGLFSLNDSRQRLAANSFSSPTTQSPQRNYVSPSDRTIAVLLIEPVQKIFEVVFLNGLNMREATVGDALAQARANAVDVTLSEQKYVSLCNEEQELAAPMLPVEFLLSKIDVTKFTTKSRNDTYSIAETKTTTPPRQKQKHSSNTVETLILLVAVPVGYTAKEMQAIKSLLWKNPKTKRWWEQHDPMRPSPPKSNKEMTK